jgi:hypothetical protein
LNDGRGPGCHTLDILARDADGRQLRDMDLYTAYGFFDCLESDMLVDPCEMDNGSSTGLPACSSNGGTLHYGAMY